MADFPGVLESAPIALVLLDSQDEILNCNQAAARMGLQTGRTLASFIDGLKGPFCEHVLNQPDASVYSLRSATSEKRCRAITQRETEGLYVWLVDITEQLAMGEQVRQLKQPGARKLRQVNQLTVAAVGYAELLDVMMAENDVLSKEKLATVRQYQAEVTKNLMAIQQVLDGETGPIRQGSVLVADQHHALAELITELLRSEGYKVVSFSDASSALKYYQVNESSIYKAVIDEDLKDQQGVTLIALLKEIAPALNIVTLSEGSASKGSVQKPLDFQMLLQAIED